VKVSSDIGAAQDALAGFGDIELDGDGQQVSMPASNIASMKAAAKVANQIVPDIAELVYRVKFQADCIVSLASEIEKRDNGDAQEWCEAR